ncbi:MAG: DUF3596 domain-containing protein [Leptolyngbyaceae cyanobacterium bins.59]|nr:DUF3596 domain-containing protein [Leptolyngbyaceae cyanobacterium bins.59]
MHSNDSRRKASKGTVQIKASHDRLQLVFSTEGKRHYLSLGLQDTHTNRKVAEARARQIELDIISGNFDSTLAKYKPQTALSTVTPITPTECKLTAWELWQRYTEYRSSSLKETTKHYHANLGRLFARLGDIPVIEALEVKAKLEKITTVYQTKRGLMQLSAACKWAKKYGLLDSNPYDGMANEMPKYCYQLDPRPNAFTEAEWEQVLEAFRNHRGNWNGRGYAGMSYSHYAPFVEFLFLTGCRPSEAVGLQWKHVSEDSSFIHFQGSITTSGNGKPIRVEGSKNNKKRRFPCSDRLRSMLQSIRPQSPDPEALVFPSPKGKTIIYNNFHNNAWDKIVDLIKPDTTPYSCRDTFITTQILKGTPETVIAKWCDTSVEMIQKCYADHLKLLSLRPID